jgi:hypothetical protein
LFLFKNKGFFFTTVIASRDLSRRGNLHAMENAPNLHNNKKIATTATQSRNDSMIFQAA